MTERRYRFAGLDIAVTLPEDLTILNEYRMKPFSVETVSDPHVFRFQRVDSLTPPAGACVYRQPDFWVYEEPDSTLRYLGMMADCWENAGIRAEHRGKVHDIQLKASAYPAQLGSKTILEVLAAEHLLVQNNGVIFHCSFIEHKGKAVLFTAPSETGKSTQADLWNQYRGSRIINGDRAAVRIANGAILAEGIPFAGSSSYCENGSLPLEAIVYLSQAPKTTVRRMRGYEAFARIWEGVTVNTWDKHDMERASAIVKQIAETIPVYHMPCTPDESAVSALEQELKKLVNV